MPDPGQSSAVHFAVDHDLCGEQILIWFQERENEAILEFDCRSDIGKLFMIQSEATALPFRIHVVHTSSKSTLQVKQWQILNQKLEISRTVGLLISMNCQKRTFDLSIPT